MSVKRKTTLRATTPRSATSRAKRNAETSRPALAGAKRTLEALKASGADFDALMSIICNNLDRTVGQILEIVNTELGITLNREQPYEILRRAASDRRLHYIAPLDSNLSVKLLEGHEWLRKARVVRSPSATDVARHAALLLLEFAEKWEKPDLHMGIAGGALLAETIHVWADFLRETSSLKIRRLFVHALVAATDDPRRSPNGFVQWLLDEALPFKTELVGLPAPAFLTPGAISELREIDGVRDAFERATDLDLIVSSAGAHWSRGCSGLHQKYAEQSPESARAFEKSGCVGDIIWQPFGPAGPVPMDNLAGKRPVTLIDLDELPQLVSRGARVMLVLAPCGGAGCGDPKSELLSAVLKWRGGVTDLVVDAHAAAAALLR